MFGKDSKAAEAAQDGQASSGDAPPPPFSAAPTAPPPPPAFSTRFACVTLSRSDRIRFINFPNADVVGLRDVVAGAWPKGVQDFTTYGQAREIKLNGYPWKVSHSGYDDSRRLLRRVLEALYDRGWVLQATVDLCKKEYDKDSLFFRYQAPAPPPCDWLSISFDRGDRLKIVDPPSQRLTAAILQGLGSAVQRHERTNSALEIKFHGYPWYPSGTDTVTTRIMVLKLLETLESFGYTTYASLDQANSSEGTDADVMIVHKQKDWQPGMPIFHR